MPPAQFPANANKLVSGFSYADALCVKPKPAKTSETAASAQTPQPAERDNQPVLGQGLVNTLPPKPQHIPRIHPLYANKQSPGVRIQENVSTLNQQTPEITTGCQKDSSVGLFMASEVDQILNEKNEKLSALQNQNADLHKQFKFLQEEVCRMEANNS